jgi:hypothetical protein
MVPDDMDASHVQSKGPIEHSSELLAPRQFIDRGYFLSVISLRLDF